MQGSLNYKDIRLSYHWNNFQLDLERCLGKTIYQTWLKTLLLEEENSIDITFSLKSRFIQDWVENNCYAEILEVVNKFNPNILDIKFIIKNSKNNVVKTSESLEIKEDLARADYINSNDNNCEISFPIDYTQTFDSYAIGEENRMAASTVQSFLKSDSFFSNIKIAFIYGSVGVGKSHLLNALCNEIKHNKKYIYLTAERFSYHYGTSVKNKAVNEFKEHFDNIDLLLIEDLQFLEGKKGTIKELCNILHNASCSNTKVILTSNKKIADFNDLDSRIKSLIFSGLATHIENPRRALKKEIISKKCLALNYSLAAEIVNFLSEQNFSSVREIEGALNKIMMHNKVFGNQLGDQEIANLIMDFIAQKKDVNISSISTIIKKLAKYFNLTSSSIISRKRTKELVFARDLSIYFAKKYTKLSLSDIGNHFGKRDHSTILHSYKKIENDQKEDLTLRLEIEKIEEIFVS